MPSDKFRRELRQEAQLWQAEGLIDASLYEQLSQRYQFHTLETAARNRFVMILVGLGSILIGLGLITFVAANWQALPQGLKVALLLSLFIGVNIAGFYLWRQPKEALQRFGHGLLLLGALILGANMGLMGQMFHISSPFYELLLAWGVGVLAMAFSLRLTSLGILSIILIAVGYLSSLFSFSFEGFSWSSLMVQHMPLLAGLLFVPLAYWCRSRVIFVLSAIALIYSLSINVWFLLGSVSRGWVWAIAFALPPALLWAYDDSLWVYGDFFKLESLPNQPQEAIKSFRPLSRSLALWSLGFFFYNGSFFWVWNLSSNFSSGEPSTKLSWFPAIDVLIFSGLAIFLWLRLLWQAKNPRTRRSLDLTTIVIAFFISLAALVIYWHFSVAEISVQATFIFNAMLFLLAAGLIREGLGRGERLAFWGGMVLLTLRILSWFLLSDTALIFKSLMFILCGVGVIAIGFWFERHVRTLEVKN